MDRKLTGGYRANLSGKNLESAVERVLRGRGVKSLSYRDWVNGAYCTDKNILLKNVPYTNIYGGNSRGEFVLMRDRKPSVRIECRSQHVAGSVDEKLPYLFENAQAMPESTVIIVVEGDGFKAKAVEWLKTKAATVKHKEILVYSLEEFNLWVSSNVKTRKLFYGHASN